LGLGGMRVICRWAIGSMLDRFDPAFRSHHITMLGNEPDDGL
jgi:hypothetical protein